MFGRYHKCLEVSTLGVLLLMTSVHLAHAGFVNFGALIDPPLGGVLLMLLFELLMQHFLFLLDDLGLLLLEFLEAHDQSFERPFVCFLQDEVFNCWI